MMRADLTTEGPQSSKNHAELFSLSRENVAWKNKTVLHDITLSIQAGEKIALLGESGAGKSTLLKTLYQQRPAEIAFCQQAPGLVPSLSVLHNIYMGELDRHSFLFNALNLFFPSQSIKAEITQLASILGLGDKLDDKAEVLSGGQQQRTALGRTFNQNQSIFLGDEPVSALDEIQSDQLIDEIIRRHNTVILALHNTDQALRHCQRIIALKSGQIVLDAPSKEVTADHLHTLYSGNNGQHTSKVSPLRRPHSGLKTCR